MRNKLALIVALASFAFATALGVSVTGAEPDPTGPAQPLEAAPAILVTPPVELPVCSNGLDDEGDGLVDLMDPDCLGDPAGASEEPAPVIGEEVPAPPAAPAPAPAPAPSPAGPEVQSGSTLDVGDARPDRDNVVENQSLGVGAGGQVASTGGVSAPRATAGDQPQKVGPSGGSAYLDGGVPAGTNPSVMMSTFGPAPIGVPNFVIDSFEIPPFLLPIYQACGTEYGVPWQVLASINKIETAFGTNLNISSAGAMGWMQFIPSSWGMYGVDATGDVRDVPANPVDGICAAGNYVKAAGWQEDPYGAIFSYNHADWYVQEVLLYAKAYGKLPAH